MHLNEQRGLPDHAVRVVGKRVVEAQARGVRHDRRERRQERRILLDPRSIEWPRAGDAPLFDAHLRSAERARLDPLDAARDVVLEHRAGVMLGEREEADHHVAGLLHRRPEHLIRIDAVQFPLEFAGEVLVLLGEDLEVALRRHQLAAAVVEASARGAVDRLALRFDVVRERVQRRRSSRDVGRRLRDPIDRCLPAALGQRDISEARAEPLCPRELGAKILVGEGHVEPDLLRALGRQLVDQLREHPAIPREAAKARDRGLVDRRDHHFAVGLPRTALVELHVLERRLELAEERDLLARDHFIEVQRDAEEPDDEPQDERGAAARPTKDPKHGGEP